MKRRRWTGWLAGMVVIGLVFGGAIVAILRFVNGPVSANAQQAMASLRPSVAPSATPSKLNTLGGVAVEFSYPGMFDAVAQIKTDAQAIEQYTIGSKANYKHQITVDVRPLASGSLADDASYRVRLNDPGTYTPTPVQLRGEPGVVMIKADHSEQTLFWAHQNKLLTLAVTSSDPADKVADILSAIEATIRWRS